MNVSVGKSHPIVVIAAIAVILFSVVGIGAVTGLIPSTFSKTAATPVAESVPGVIPPAPLAPAPTPVAVEEPKPAPPVTNNEVREPVSAPKAHVAKKPRPAPKPQEVAGSDAPYAPPGPLATAEPPPAPKICRECGVIEAVTPIEKQGKASGLGAVAGGVLGGVLGHQVGSGRGKDLATVAGAIGGALGGNQIEKSQKKSVEYDVIVRLDDNTAQTVHFQAEPGFRVGEQVKLSGGQIVRR